MSICQCPAYIPPANIHILTRAEESDLYKAYIETLIRLPWALELPHQDVHSNSKLTDLPPSVRKRIYQYAGLLCDYDFDARSGGVVLRQGDRGSGCLTVTRRILHVSRMMHLDAWGVLYSQNAFHIGAIDFEAGLTWLSSLTPDHCSQLRDLSVAMDTMHKGVINVTDVPSEEPDQEANLQKWQKCATHLLSNAKPGQLTLRLICDTGEVNERAKAFLEPLSKFPHLLRDLDLSLGGPPFFNKNQAPQAREIGEAAVERTAQPPAEPQPFRFMDLPPEIRLRVLRFTNCARPFTEVDWCPYSRKLQPQINGGSCSRARCQKGDAGKHYNHVCKFFNNKCAGNREGPEGEPRFFCSRIASAYSSSCRHDWAPLSLMLTSRAMYDMAVDVFLSDTRLVLYPQTPSMEIEGPGSSKAAPSPPTVQDDVTFQFVNKVWPEFLHRLRTLDITFPSMDRYLEPEDAYSSFSSWYRAVDYLADHLDVRGLTLIIQLPQGGNGVTPWRYFPGEKISPVHAQVLTPLRALSHMRRFFVHLEWPPSGEEAREPPRLPVVRDIPGPIRRGRPTLIRRRYLPPLPPRVKTAGILEMEAKLERFVMGPNYDSASLGKGDVIRPANTFIRHENGRMKE